MKRPQVSTEDLPENESTRGIRATGDRLARLAGGLEEWIEPTAEESSDYSLARVIDDCVEHIRAEGLSASILVEGEPDARAVGRRSRICRALHLVLQNAARHAPAGTTIQIVLQTGVESHSITVRDRGVGLPRGKEQLVWSPLFRRAKGGVGLGLAIARRFVVEDGGAVHASTAPEGGAVVVLTLPRAR